MLIFMPHKHLLGSARFAPLLAIAALLSDSRASFGQATWEPLTVPTTASFRGLSVVDDRVAWASGTRGTVIHTTDGGATWRVDSIPGAGTMDLRAIHAINARTAIVAATAGRIWRTTDGGRTWSLRYQATDTTVFLDAVAFADSRFGITLGDPMGGRFLMLVTQDGGANWAEAPLGQRPQAVSGEAAFAASGTSLVFAQGRAWLGTGGAMTRVYRSENRGQDWTAVAPGVLSVEGTGGIFSVAFADSLNGVVVGGDYQQPDSVLLNAAVTTDGGRTWAISSQPPRGYRSGVALHRDGDRLTAIAVGTNGSDVSRDGGLTWSPLDSSAFNAIQFAPSGVAFAVGARGRIARLDSRSLPH